MAAKRSTKKKTAKKKAAKKAVKKRATKKKVARRSSRSPKPPTAPVVTTAKVEPDRAADYELKKERARRREAELSESGRDIGDIPAVKNPERREACRRDFLLFCKTYGAHVFALEWSQPHLEAGERFQRVAEIGGLAALAMTRGWGKTSLAQWAVKFGVLYALRHFVVYVGATADEAYDRLAEIKTELETNDLLLEDFPEICYPIHQLEGITQRAKGQLYKGERTQITWGKRRIILPTIPGSAASGSVIDARGITGAMRGMKHTTPEGKIIRPDMAIGDDPQTEQSARSPYQVNKRLKIINGAMLNLSGPGRRIAAMVPCTVVEPDDLADQLLDREKNPHWQGQRSPALGALPKDDKLWDRYATARAEGLRNEDGGEAGNRFYKKHRKQLDAGADVIWPQNIKEGDVSALQTLMNIKIDDEESFWAEYMQQPMSRLDHLENKPEPDEIARQIVNIPAGIVPMETPRLVAFIDPNYKLLWWMVCAFGDGFTGHIVDYGAWPDQGRNYWTTRDAGKTMNTKMPRGSLASRLLNGLEALTDDLLGREWLNEQKQPGRIERCLVDANLGEISDTVYQFCRQSKHAAILTPSHGHFLGARDRPMYEWKQEPSDRMGHHWRERMSKTKAKRFVSFDANRWKTAVFERLSVPRGGPGALTIHAGSRVRHRMLLDHLAAEYPEPDDHKGRTINVWKELKNRDNDLLDALAGCHVGASMQGIAIAGQDVPKARRRRPRVRYAK